MSTISINGPRSLFVIATLVAFSSGAARAQGANYELGGHVKARALADYFPDNSVIGQTSGSSWFDLESDLRVNFSARQGAFEIDADWQLFASYGDRVEQSQTLLPAGLPGFVGIPTDDRRLMDLTDTIKDGDRFRALHRLDRLSVGYSSEKLVLRLGRQAISWGNGLIFSPMDIVNPFDPTIVDTEYKIGDDMAYGQFLLSNDDDIQFSHVFRRDPVSGDTDSDVATTALKYHGILGDAEIDLLVARSYDETTFGIGGNKSVGGAVWRGDVVLSDTASGNRLQLVTNFSYSWQWGGRNMSGVVEYFFTEFGQKNGQYDLPSVTQNTALTNRLARGESFTLGRNYLAGGITIEVNPLWLVTPNLFANLDDSSALLQVTTVYSISDDAEFLGAINLPIGPDGTEFGGIRVGQDNLFYSTELSLFAQLAWYF
ncbi:MAG: hypothetical protein ACR2Q3_03710 [Woeseiaceae bacterium]